MSVVCRFAVSEITNGPNYARVKLNARYSPDGSETPEVMAEIKAFFDATPSGSFEMTTTNDKAAEQFQVGQQFYLRLDPVPVDG